MNNQNKKNISLPSDVTQTQGQCPVKHQDVTAVLTREHIQKALQCLADNGIEEGECAIVLQALCYILMDIEIEDLLEEEDWDI